MSVTTPLHRFWRIATQAVAAASIALLSGCGTATLTEPSTDATDDHIFGPKKVWNIGDVVAIRSLPIASASNAPDTRYIGFPIKLAVTIKPRLGTISGDLAVGLVSYAYDEQDGAVVFHSDANRATFKDKTNRRAICLFDQKLHVEYTHDETGRDEPFTVIGEFTIPETCLSNRGTAGRPWNRHRELAKQFDEGEFRVFLGQDIEPNKFFQRVKGLKSHHVAMRHLLSHRRVHVFDRTKDSSPNCDYLERTNGTAPGCFPKITVKRAEKADLSMKSVAVSSHQAIAELDTCLGQHGEPLFSVKGTLQLFGSKPPSPSLGDAGAPAPNAIHDLFARSKYPGAKTDGKAEVRVHYSLCPTGKFFEESEHGTDSPSGPGECAGGTDYVPLEIRANENSGDLPSFVGESGEALERHVQQLLALTDSPRFSPFTAIQQAAAGASVDFGEEIYVQSPSEACRAIMGEWKNFDIYNVRACAVAPFEEDSDVDSSNCKLALIKITRAIFPDRNAPKSIPRPTDTELKHDVVRTVQLLGGKQFNVRSTHHETTRLSAIDGAHASSTFDIVADGDWIAQRKHGKKLARFASLEIKGDAPMQLNGGSKSAKLSLFGRTIQESGDTLTNKLAFGYDLPVIAIPIAGVFVSLDLQLIGSVGWEAAFDLRTSEKYIVGEDEANAFGADVRANSRRFAKPNDRIRSGRLRYTIAPTADVKAALSASIGVGLPILSILRASANASVMLFKTARPSITQLQWELVHPHDRDSDRTDFNATIMRAARLMAARSDVGAGECDLRLTISAGASGLGCMGMMSVYGTSQSSCSWSLNESLWSKSLISWPGKRHSTVIWHREDDTLLARPR